MPKLRLNKSRNDSRVRYDNLLSFIRQLSQAIHN